SAADDWIASGGICSAPVEATPRPGGEGARALPGLRREAVLPVTVPDATLAAHFPRRHEVGVRLFAVREAHRTTLEEDGALLAHVRVHARLRVHEVELTDHLRVALFDQCGINPQIDGVIRGRSPRGPHELRPFEESVIRLTGEQGPVHEQAVLPGEGHGFGLWVLPPRLARVPVPAPAPRMPTPPRRVPMNGFKAPWRPGTRPWPPPSERARRS